MKRTGSTNPLLQDLIGELKKRSNEQEVNLWKRVAIDLEKPTRQRRSVNLSNINRHTKEDETIIIPGKVLGAGSVGHKLTISAYQFSESAKEKLKKNGSVIIPLVELAKDNPKGKGIRIIG